MCFSNCPYENYHGECQTSEPGPDAHCYDGPEEEEEIEDGEGD